MRKNHLSIGNIILLLWVILILYIFVSFPGSVNFLQWVNFARWQELPAKLGRIDLIHFVLNFFYSLLGIIIYSLANISFGMFITKTLHVFDHFPTSSILSKLAVFFTNFLIGQGVFSLLFLTLGVLFELTPTIVAVILIFGVILGIKHLKGTFTNIFLKVQIADRKSRVLFWLSVTIMLLTILQSSARISYDSSAIYFSDAKLTATVNKVQFFTDNTFVASVFHNAIQYTALIQLFGDQSARMFSWVFGIVIVVFSLAIGENVGLSERARIILLALLLTTTAFTDLLGDGKVDLISSAPAIAAIFWMSVDEKDQFSGRLILPLIGFLIGLAIIGRPFNAFLLGIFLLFFYFHKSFIRNGISLASTKNFFNSMFWIGVGAIGLGLFHLFVNWKILGHPFGFFSSYTNIDFTSGPWDADLNQMLILRILYPFVATFRNTPQSLGNISPLVLAFTPALFMAGLRRKIKFSRDLLTLMIISALTLVIWIYSFFTVVEIRYVLFLWIILYLPVALIIDSVFNFGNRVTQNLMMVTVTFFLFFINIRTLFISFDSYSPLDRQGNPQCYDFLPCMSLKPINQSAAPGDRVLTLGAYRYYLRTDLFLCSTTEPEYKVLQDLSFTPSDAFWEEVYRQGYKYIAYENDYTVRHLGFGIIPSPANVPNWMELTPLFGEPNDLVVSYKILVTNSPFKPQKFCIEDEYGIWKLKSFE